MSNTDFKIDLTEEFDLLRKAPIVEAVIHWRARSEKKLDPDALLNQLKEKLPEYPDPKRQHKLEFAAKLSPGRSSIHQESDKWDGFRFESNDKLYVAQFTRDGFILSRLKPYEEWDKFEAEAQRLWHIYYDLTKPSEIQRLGVRFINLITPVRTDQLSELLTVPPHSPEGMQLPLQAFMHQSTFEIPDNLYKLNVIQTIQPLSPPKTDTFNLILDLDVTTTQELEIDDQKLKNRLLEMRWIKNKAFFTLLRQEAIAQFME